MIRLIFLVFFLPLTLFSQTSFQSWNSAGVKGKINKKFDWAGSMTARVGDLYNQTYFPQGSIKYKATKWFRPSIDYRAIIKRENNGNYSFTNRLNFNAEFKHVQKRFTFSARLRYQYLFNRLKTVSDFDVEYDQAFRIKPEVSYDINNSFITPLFSIEYFFDPTYNPLGRRFTKYRAFIGVDLELDSPHEISIGYMLDQQINRPAPSRKHILSINYAYNLGFKKKKN